MIATEAFGDVIGSGPGRVFALIAKSEIPRNVWLRSYFEHQLAKFI